MSRQRSGLKTVKKSDTDSYDIECIEEGKIASEKVYVFLIIFLVDCDILFGLLLVDI